jgi:hypothetical protein
MFIVFVQSETHSSLQTGYYTNMIYSKNDGALIAFTDSNGFIHNVDPTRISIDMNIDAETHIAKTKE